MSHISWFLCDFKVFRVSFPSNQCFWKVAYHCDRYKEGASDGTAGYLNCIEGH